MSKTKLRDCIPIRELQQRGLDLQEGSIIGGNCQIGLDPEDNAVLIDENGNIVYKKSIIPFDQFDSFLREGAANNRRLTVRSIEDYDLVTVGRGQVFSFPPGSLQGNGNVRPGKIEYTLRGQKGRHYHLARSDSFQEHYVLSRSPTHRGQPRWLLQQTVFAPDGRRIRERDKYLSKRLREKDLETYTQWFSGDHPFLMTTDRWLYGAFYGNFAGDLPRQISLHYNNPARDLTFEVEEPAGNQLEVGSLTDRLGVMSTLDQYMARHNFRLDLAQKTIRINDRAFALVTAPGDQKLTEAETNDMLYGIVYAAPFLRHIPLDASTRIFVGKPSELVQQAVDQGLSLTCQQNLMREQFDGLYCQQDGAIFLKTHPDEYQKETVTTHNTTVAHELGHALQLQNPDLLQAFHPFFLNYCFTSFLRAGIPRGEKFEFLHWFVTSPIRTIDLSYPQKETLAGLWVDYNLERYFPSLYSLSNEGEFFAELVGGYRPWHPHEADQRDYYPFYSALDALGKGGVNDFAAELHRQFPDLHESGWQIAEPENSAKWGWIGLGGVGLGAIICSLGQRLYGHPIRRLGHFRSMQLSGVIAGIGAVIALAGAAMFVINHNKS